MKNIYLLPTDKPSRLLQSLKVIELLDKEWLSPIGNVNRNIYITSDEEIKEGDWFLTDDKRVEKDATDWRAREWHRKIILTTDPDLIKDGVQEIDDEFLHWFVKNPSYEGVEIKKNCNNCGNENCVHAICHSQIAQTKGNTYKIIIPKQETIEDELWGNVFAKIKQYGLNYEVLTVLKQNFNISKR